MTRSSGRGSFNWAAVLRFPHWPGRRVATTFRASPAPSRRPLDHDQPRGPAIGIALAKVPAADRVHKIGTVFVNPGGPGGSGVGLVINGFGEYLGALLEGRFDVVGFDPRGVASSEPLRCFDSNEAEAALLAGAPLFPYEPAGAPFF